MEKATEASWRRGPGESPLFDAAEGETASPGLATGIELLGEFRGSGSTDARYLIRRKDGTMLVLSRVPFLLTEEIDGRAGPAQLAERLSLRTGRTIDSNGVRYLLDHKLGPLGIVERHEHGPSPASLLKLSGRKALISPPVVWSIASRLRYLFQPIVVALVVACTIVMHALLIDVPGALTSSTALLDRPGTFLLIVAITLLGGLFHELGHATASAYGGARPGAIGVGFYLCWPAFFTDITESYRLDRLGRVRTDLGGIYFNLLLTLPLGAAYGFTSQRVWLWAVLAQHLIIVQQLLPFLRLDAYYLMTDLTGIPDLFGYVKPVLSGLVPGRAFPPKVERLKAGVRIAVTGWVISTACFLAWLAVWLLPAVPSLLRVVWNRTASLWYFTAQSLSSAGGLETSANIVRALLGTLQLIGLLVLLTLAVRLACRYGRAVVARCAGNA